jgi:hypothetical protein
MPKTKDKIKSYDITLQNYIDKKEFVKIYRTFKDNSENIRGFILKMTKDFLLVQLDNDFFLDGYAIIRKDQFDSIRCSKYEKACKKILKAEGIFDDIDLRSWQSVFKSIKKLDFHVIVECESLDEPDFIIGPIKRVTQNSTSIQFYDSTGLLEDKLSIVKYIDITIAKFDDRYTKTYKKYLKTSKLTT